MKIIGSYTSPFSRIVRAVCEELELDYEFEVTAPFGKLTEAHEHLINTNNPLMKVPILIDQGQTVLDSRIIINYLLRTYKAPSTFEKALPLSIADQNRLSIVYGIQEAGVLRFILGKEGFDGNTGYLKRSLERIESGLAYLDSDKTFGDTFGLPELGLICCLDWFSKRDIVDWKRYKHLLHVHEKFRNRPSLVKTSIPADL